MISKYTYKKLTWIDLESPTKDEVYSLMEEYSLPSLVGEELMTQTLRSKVDLYDSIIYMILHFPVISNKTHKSNEQEVDFVIGKNFIITAHYEMINPLHEFSKMFETDSTLDKSLMGNHAGFLFFYIIRELYKNAMLELEDINDSLRDIEKNIFDGREGEMVAVISNLNRTLVDFKQAIRFHRETLRSFEGAGTKFFGTEFSYYLSAITGEYNKVQNVLEGHKDILDDLKNTNDSLLTSKTSDTIKKLTIMTFIMLPLTLITGIFGMNTEMILIKSLSNFGLVILFMIIIGTGMFVYFKKKRWF